MHGLEGDAQRHYITGSAKRLTNNNFDTCAVNFRGCSGETNRLYRSYHSGATEDLVSVINFILSNKAYEELYLMGFSLGGNLTLKYLGEGHSIPKKLKAAVAVSVPCDLKDACDELLKSKNVLYSQRFKKNLLAKLREKRQQFPDAISEAQIKGIVTLKDFDDVYTGPAHGFKDALDYYEKCSSKSFLPNIPIPSLILNAKDDSFLGARCYPYEENLLNPNLQNPEPTKPKPTFGNSGIWRPCRILGQEKCQLCRTAGSRILCFLLKLTVKFLYISSSNRSDMKKLILCIALGAFVASCGGKKEEKKDGFEVSRTKTEDKKADTSEGVPVDLDNKGIGPIKNIDFPDAIDTEMAARGEAKFNAICVACHQVEGRMIGPPMKGVYERRSPEWVMNMMLNPNGMLKDDPIAKALLKEYNNAIMLNQNLTEDEARELAEYLRTL